MVSEYITAIHKSESTRLILEGGKDVRPPSETARNQHKEYTTQGMEIMLEIKDQINKSAKTLTQKQSKGLSKRYETAKDQLNDLAESLNQESPRPSAGPSAP